MSTTSDAGTEIAGCRPAEGTPVSIDASALESTADTYLRSLKRDLDAAGYVPVALVIDVDFDADCSLTTQAEVDRVRDLVRAADFLGVGRVRLDVGTVANDRKVRPAIQALRERAQRDGLSLAVDADDL